MRDMNLSEWARRALQPKPYEPPPDPPQPRGLHPVAPDVVWAYYELGADLLQAATKVEGALDQAAADRRSPGVADAGYLVAHVRLMTDRLEKVLLRLQATPDVEPRQAERVRAARNAMRAAADNLAGLGEELAPDYPFDPTARG